MEELKKCLLRAALVACAVVVAGASCACRTQRAEPELIAQPEPVPQPVASAPPAKLALPAPASSGSMSVEEALASRRSRRQFAPTPLPLAELGQLAWAAQGITDQAEGYRTAPSSGALYPLELHFVTADGVLHYLPASHTFERRSDQDLREALAKAALDQAAVRLAACDVVITSVTDRTRRKYGERATRYVGLEAGHVGQNLLLQATARGLVGVPIGAFEDEAISQVLGLPAREEPLYMIALGYPPESAGR